jgi:hypothetical protein
MRHLGGLAFIEVPLLPSGVIGPALVGLLIGPPRKAQRVLTSRLGAVVAAVPVTAVAPAAQVEHQPAARAAHKP